MPPPPKPSDLVEHEDAHGLAEAVLRFCGMQQPMLAGTMYSALVLAQRAMLRALRESGYTPADVAEVDQTMTDGCVSDVYRSSDLDDAVTGLRIARAQQMEQRALDAVVDPRAAAEMATTSMLAAIADVKNGWKRPDPDSK